MLGVLKGGYRPPGAISSVAHPSLLDPYSIWLLAGFAKIMVDNSKIEIMRYISSSLSFIKGELYLIKSIFLEFIISLLNFNIIKYTPLESRGAVKSEM